MNHSFDDPDRNPIEVIADEFVERLRRGEQPTVEEYAERHPEIASDILELLPTVIAMEELKNQKEQTDRSRFLRGPGSLTRLGDFLILAEIGRGGMGIVYEAEQQSLGRHVAVKVLPRQSLLDEHRLQRFQREAQIAARLHHTNIVPIFGVGEQDGYHYYVMQFIRGLGLDSVVRELRGDPPTKRPDQSGTDMSGLAREAASALRNGRFPQSDQGSAERDDATAATPITAPGKAEPDQPTVAGTPTHRSDQFWRSVARVGMQVADALSYAHSQGTLHRDIKPANLLLDGHGVIWITDFGLAKAMEDSNITNSGDVVGTLQYMAPEQFCGNYDARSDIYCLGLTLYELLTLQPAHQGSNRSGLIHKVTQSAPLAPRRIDSSIPADLETVILKAISREPSHRYASAAELRDDLQRFIEDRPILARRTNPAQLVWRWCRRNRALASAMAVAAVAVLAATFLGWASYVAEAERRREVVTVNQRIRESSKLQQQVFEKIFHRLVGPNVFQSMIRVDAGTSNATDSDGEASNTDYQSISIPTVSQQDAKLLQDVLEFYDLFAAQNEDLPELQINSAVAYHHMGDIRLRLGKLDAARDAYIKAIQHYRLQPDHQRHIASVRNQLGQVYANQQILEAARESYALVIEALQRDDGTPRFAAAQWRLELARAHDFMGSLGIRQREEEMQQVRRSSRRGQPGRQRPTDPRGRGTMRWNAKRLAGPTRLERDNHHQSAQRLLAQLVEEFPGKPTYRLAKARSCRNFASFLSIGRFRSRNGGSRQRIEALSRTAIETLEQLAAEFPDVPHFKFELAETLITIRPGRSEASISAVRERWAAQVVRAEAMLRDLHDAFPTVPSYLESLARVHYERHRTLMLQGDHAAGVAALRRAIESMQALSQRWPGNPSYLRQLSQLRLPHVEILEHEVDSTGPWLDPAIEEMRRSITEFEAFRRAMLVKRQSDLGLAERYRKLSRLLEKRGEPDQAEAARKRARELSKPPR